MKQRPHLVHNLLVCFIAEKLPHHLPEAKTTGYVQRCISVLVLGVHECLGGVPLQQSRDQVHTATSTGIVQWSLIVLGGKRRGGDIETGKSEWKWVLGVTKQVISYCGMHIRELGISVWALCMT